MSPLNTVLKCYVFTFIFAVLLQFANSIKFISGLYTVVFSDWIAYEGAKIAAISQHNKPVLRLFSLRLRRNAYLRASDQKSDLAVRFDDHHFL